MKTALLLTLLCLGAWNVQAQPVTASTDVLEFAPVQAPGQSPVESVLFTSQTDETVSVYGLGANGPFAFDWTCSDGLGVELPPGGTCELLTTFTPPAGQPLGLTEGLVGFRLSTGTLLVDLRGFVYTTQPVAGVRNLRESLQPLGFDPASIAWLTQRLDSAEAVLLDGNPNNDRRACGLLMAFTRRVIHEAASGSVSDWSAEVLGVQAEAVAQGGLCGGA
jgi:hypothetical protein